MARKKIQQPEPERWVTAREAIAILNEKSNRDDIKVPYIRQLVRAGKVKKKEEGLDGRTALYLHSDLTKIVVQKHRNVDTVEARKGGSRQKSRRADVASEQVQAEAS